MCHWFEWDEAKNLSKLKKHGLSFDEAKALFESERDHLETYDAAHSDTEDRLIAIGEIRKGVAVVVFTERDEDMIRTADVRARSKDYRDSSEEWLLSTHSRYSWVPLVHLGEPVFYQANNLTRLSGCRGN